MSDAQTPRGGRAPVGRSLYLRVMAALPEDRRPALRDSATRVRHVKLTIRLFRQRWVRRARRSVRRGQRRVQRRWIRLARRVRRLLRTVQRVAIRTERRFRRSEPTADSTSPDVAAGDQPRVTVRQRSALMKRLFPATVPLSGTGNVVLVDAMGRSTSDAAAASDRFGERWVVATDDPNVGVLRAAGVNYEYVPSDFEGGLRARVRWLDYVYGLDEVVLLSDLEGCDTPR